MKKNGSRLEGARGLHGRGRRFRPARFLANIWCFQVDPKVGFVKWVRRLVLVRIVSIVMDPYSIDASIVTIKLYQIFLGELNEL